MIVLDKSSSMKETIDGTTKFDAAVAAIKQVIAKYPAINFGLEMFSVPASGGMQNDCTNGPGKIYVNIAPNTGPQIESSMGVAADGNGTPIAGGLTVGGQDPALSDPTRSENVVVVTDGEENCRGNPVSVIKELLARTVSVRTWVVGFGSQVDATMLTNMAVAGDTARSTTPKYYQADAPADLLAALAAIAQGASCSFALAQPPPIADGGGYAQVTIVVNGATVSWDPTHVSGWDYDPATGRMTLYGAACQSLATGSGGSSSGSGSAASVGVQYACASSAPDPVDPPNEDH